MTYTQNDIFAFYEVINDIKPQKVLDVGMFLKSVGSVSRKIMNLEIDEKVWLMGIDFCPVIQFPVFREIYNEIYTTKEFIHKEETIKRIDLGIYLEARNRKLLGKEKQIIEKVLGKCSYFLSNDVNLQELCEKRPEDTITIHVENNEYYIFVLRK